MDVSFPTRTMVAADRKGFVTWMTLEGEKIWDKKLYKTNCYNVEFSERQSWMMVTTGTELGKDSVKVWDIRNIKGKDSALAELHHDEKVNSAHFSLQSGDKLLTTDCSGQMRIYQAPHFSLVRTIHHPSTHYSLSPMEAYWHPLADIVIKSQVGEKRTIDFICPDSGELLHGLQLPGLSRPFDDDDGGLSQFNCSGEKMMSGESDTVIFWETRPGEEE